MHKMYRVEHKNTGWIGKNTGWTRKKYMVVVQTSGQTKPKLKSSGRERNVGDGSVPPEMHEMYRVDRKIYRVDQKKRNWDVRCKCRGQRRV